MFALQTLIDATNNNCAIIAQRRKDHLPLQPRMVLVGTIPEIAAHVYVVDITYTLANVCEAFEACFKCFIALNCEYPTECDHVWYVVQKCVYGITTPYDKKIASIESFIKDLSA